MLPETLSVDADKRHLCNIILTLLFTFLEENIWTLDLSIPADVDVEYRYFIASVDPSDSTNSVHIRKWETHLQPRRILKNEGQAPNALDNFGIVDGVEKVDKGWLTGETIFQFKFFNNPFLLKERIKNRLLYVKVIIKAQKIINIFITKL